MSTLRQTSVDCMMYWDSKPELGVDTTQLQNLHFPTRTIKHYPRWLLMGKLCFYFIEQDLMEIHSSLSCKLTDYLQPLNTWETMRWMWLSSTRSSSGESFSRTMKIPRAGSLAISRKTSISCWTICLLKKLTSKDMWWLLLIMSSTCLLSKVTMSRSRNLQPNSTSHSPHSTSLLIMFSPTLSIPLETSSIRTRKVSRKWMSIFMIWLSRHFPFKSTHSLVIS